MADRFGIVEAVVGALDESGEVRFGSCVICHDDVGVDEVAGTSCYGMSETHFPRMGFCSVELWDSCLML